MLLNVGRPPSLEPTRVTQQKHKTHKSTYMCVMSISSLKA